jgi:hypothetical protein
MPRSFHHLNFVSYRRPLERPILSQNGGTSYVSGVLFIEVRPFSRCTSRQFHSQISFPSSTLHLLILFPLPTQRQRQLIQRNLHSEFVDHQLDIDILSAVGSESGKRVAQRRLELQSH